MSLKRKTKVTYDPSKEHHTHKNEIVKINDATSSKLEMDFHDLPYAGLAAAARRFYYGRKRHGRFNWTKGNAAFAEERLKHAVNHLMLFCQERKQVDLDAVLCNLMMIADFDARGILSHNPKVDFMLEGKDEPSSK